MARLQHVYILLESHLLVLSSCEKGNLDTEVATGWEVPVNEIVRDATIIVTCFPEECHILLEITS